MIVFDVVLGPELELGPVDVDAGQTFHVVATADVAFRPLRLLVHERDAAHFEIVGLEIDGRQQLSNSTPFPSEIFSPLADNVLFGLDLSTMKPGDEAILTVHNTGRARRRFLAELFGRCRLEDLATLERVAPDRQRR